MENTKNTSNNISKKIAIFTSPQGHESIAYAIESKIKSEYITYKFLEENLFYNLYRPIYRYFPSLGTSALFSLGKNKNTIKLVKKILFAYNKKTLANFINKQKPDLFINTHYFFSPFLEKYSEENNIPFINIITDPKTIHPILLAEKTALNLAFDDETIETSNKINPQAKLLKFGWFVRSEYEREYNQKVLKKKLTLQNKFTILVVSGSDGSSTSLKIIPAIMAKRKDIQLIVACGNNKTLYKSTVALQKLAEKTNSKTEIIPLSFTNKLYEYMQAADLIVGKAGPNTLFEAAATLTPFFAITHISGQEDGNLDIIRNYNLGYVEENPLKASKILINIIENPKQLEKFQTSLVKMKEYNQKSKDQLLLLIKKLLDKN